MALTALILGTWATVIALFGARESERRMKRRWNAKDSTVQVGADDVSPL